MTSPSVKPSQKFLEDALFIVDASSYIFRAYYGLQTELKAPDGTPTHATYAFVQMIRALANSFKTKRVLLVWDRKEPSFRKKIYDQYKANRSQPPEDLGLQITNTQKVMELWGYPQLSAAGFEADDVIATLTKKIKDPMVIVTADKDLLQLVDDHVWCLDTKKNQWSNLAEAELKFGVAPDRIRFVQAIMGDSSDNIPGAPGIGPKGAAELIKHFGNLEAVLDAAASRAGDLDKKYPDPLSGKKLKSIVENIPQIKTSLELVCLVEDVSIPEAVLYEKKHPPKVQELVDELTRLGFTRFVAEVERVEEHLGTKSLEPDKDLKPTPPKTLETLGVERENKNFKTVSSLAELKSLLAIADKFPEFAFDTETFSLERYKPENLVGFSFAWDGVGAYYAPLRHRGSGNLPAAEALDLILKFTERKTTLFHSAKFDWHQLEGEGKSFSGKYHDSLLASFVLDVTGSHNLENLSERYLGAQPSRFADVVKKGEDFSFVPLELATYYAAEDAHLTFRLWKHFEKLLEEQNLFRLYDEVDRPLARVLFVMERIGVKIDANYLGALYRDLEKERFEEENKARDILKGENVIDYETINFASPKQLAKLLFEDLKLPILKKGKTGPSTDADVMADLSLQHPFPKVLLEYRELSKLISTYVQPLPTLINEYTARLHTSFSQTIAQTGRLASSEPNLQNIPIRTERGGRIRKAFTAEEGFQIYSADYSQIELRFLAEVTQDEELCRAFRDGADIHARTAALIFGKSESEITSDERRSAKTINFGIIYGQTPFGLAKTLGIPRQDASRFIENYFAGYPKLKVWMDQVLAEARKTGEVRTLIGRRRAVENINSKNPGLRNFSERMAVNSPLQGTAADLIKLSMTRVLEWIESSKAPVRLVLQIHDELLFEVKDGFEREFHPILKNILEDENVFVPFNGQKLRTPLQTDHSVGPNWGELKEI